MFSPILDFTVTDCRTKRGLYRIYQSQLVPLQYTLVDLMKAKVLANVRYESPISKNLIVSSPTGVQYASLNHPSVYIISKFLININLASINDGMDPVLYPIIASAISTTWNK